MVFPENIVKNVARLGVVSGMTVADFGSGIGDYALSLAERVAPTGKVYAVDIHDDALLRLKHDAEKASLGTVVRIVHKDLEEEKGSGLPESSLDLVLATDILFQMENKEKLFKEAFRVLSPGGILALIERATDSHVPMSPDLVVTPEQVTCLAAEAGFVEEKKIDTDTLHYGYLFLKPHVVSI
jgi:ubiquinone/menaquinone biosynthesis C-methylase UbiE